MDKSLIHLTNEIIKDDHLVSKDMNYLKVLEKKFISTYSSKIKNTEKIIFVSEWVRRRFFSDLDKKLTTKTEVIYPSVIPQQPMKKEKIIIGSRRSKLALIYAQKVKNKILENSEFKEDQIIITEVDKKAYLSSLKLSDYIIVTCDSTSMISESALTGKPIYIASILPKKNEKNTGWQNSK